MIPSLHSPDGRAVLVLDGISRALGQLRNWPVPYAELAARCELIAATHDTTERPVWLAVARLAQHVAGIDAGQCGDTCETCGGYGTMPCERKEVA